MLRFSKMFGHKLMIGCLGLGLTMGIASSYGGVETNPSSYAGNGAMPVASQPAGGDYTFFSYKGKKVLVRLLKVKDRDWVGQCVDEDDVSIIVQINNNFFRFFYGDIEYIESL